MLHLSSLKRKSNLIFFFFQFVPWLDRWDYNLSTTKNSQASIKALFGAGARGHNLQAADLSRSRVPHYHGIMLMRASVLVDFVTSHL